MIINCFHASYYYYYYYYYLRQLAAGLRANWTEARKDTYGSGVDKLWAMAESNY